MIIAIIQARMGSSRFPNKVMLNIINKPVLWHVINRTSQSKKIDKIVVATSNNYRDKVIIDFCNKYSLNCETGSENDVLDRFYQIIKRFNINDNDVVVRITADCPLIDPFLIDQVIDFHIENSFEYTSNTIHPTFPDGLDCEVFQASVLKKIWEKAIYKSDREHVTLYIRKHPEIFKIGSYKTTSDLSHLRWTLDEKEDYDFIKKIYENLYNEKVFFNSNDILDLLNKNPQLVKVNSMYARNEGLKKSLDNDSLFKLEQKEVIKGD